MNTTYSVVKRLMGQASTSGKQGGFRKLLARISRFVLELLIFMAGKYISKLGKKHRNHFSLKRMALGQRGRDCTRPRASWGWRIMQEWGSELTAYCPEPAHIRGV